MSERPFLISKHRRFLQHCLNVLPSEYSSLDSNRLTLLFFALGGLDVLDELHQTINNTRINQIINWIYSLQLTIDNGYSSNECHGFCGSFASIGHHNGDSYHCAHLAQTYSALCCLLILNDDLSRVDRIGILRGLKACQMPDGSFCAQSTGDSENDMRFVYCAVAISYIIGDFSALNISTLTHFIKSSLSYDGGIGQGPRLESHGGSTYCAIASLHLLNHLWDESVLTKVDINRLRRWCLLKQSEGFHGRANKPDDSCYAFWIGATLTLLNSYSFVDDVRLRQFLMSTQDRCIGGFGKHTIDWSAHPDILHTYFSLVGLSLLHEPNVASISPALNLTARTNSHLHRLLSSYNN